MEKLLKKFREEFQDKVIGIHWRQWSCLGVASQLEEEKKWIIDLESVLSSTLFVGRFDRRLLSTALEWMFKYGEWINLSRLKRIGGSFHRTDEKLNVSLVPQTVFEVLENTIKQSSRLNQFQGIKEHSSQYNLPEEYREAFEIIQDRGVTTEPEVRKLPKIVYRILEQWNKSGLIEKEMGRKYVLAGEKLLFSGLGSSGNLPLYINWRRTFHLFARILAALSTEPWSSDAYLLSSLFRHISEETKVIARYVNVTFSDSSLYKGAEYISPFTKDIIHMLKNMW